MEVIKFIPKNQKIYKLIGAVWYILKYSVHKPICQDPVVNKACPIPSLSLVPCEQGRGGLYGSVQRGIGGRLRNLLWAPGRDGNSLGSCLFALSLTARGYLRCWEEFFASTNFTNDGQSSEQNI